MTWAIEHGCPTHARLSHHLAEGGYLKMLRVAIENSCPCTQDTLLTLVRKGHIKMFKWVMKHAGCTGDTADITYELAKQSPMKTLEWAIRKGCSCDERVGRILRLSGATDLLELAILHGCPIHQTPSESVLVPVSFWLQATGLRDKGTS